VRICKKWLMRLPIRPRFQRFPPGPEPNDGGRESTEVLEKRHLTKLIEYPHLFNGSRWVLTDLGEIKLQLLLRTADIPDEPAKTTAIPVRSISGYARLRGLTIVGEHVDRISRCSAGLEA